MESRPERKPSIGEPEVTVQLVRATPNLIITRRNGRITRTQEAPTIQGAYAVYQITVMALE
jgi:hypothetical protein